MCVPKSQWDWQEHGGQVVRDKTHDWEVVGLIPNTAVETIYHAPLI